MSSSHCSIPAFQFPFTVQLIGTPFPHLRRHCPILSRCHFLCADQKINAGRFRQNSEKRMICRTHMPFPYAVPICRYSYNRNPAKGTRIYLKVSCQANERNPGGPNGSKTGICFSVRSRDHFEGAWNCFFFVRSAGPMFFCVRCGSQMPAPVHLGFLYKSILILFCFFRANERNPEPADGTQQMFFIPANVFSSERTNEIPAGSRTRNVESKTRALRRKP